MLDKQEINNRYQLRYAAGQYWLLDMEQEGMPYKRPLSVNKLGADIWNKTIDGQTTVKIAGALSEEYGVAVDEIEADIKQFYEHLEAYGVLLKK